MSPRVSRYSSIQSTIASGVLNGNRGSDCSQSTSKGKTVVLGLVTSKDPRLENQDELMRKVDAASNLTPLDQLAVSPECGYGGSADNTFTTPDEQWRKLGQVVHTAQKICG